MTKQSRYERVTCATGLPRPPLQTPRNDSLAITALVAMFALAAPALAQTYPSKPVRIIVGFPAGGATDVVARTISQKLGLPFIVGSFMFLYNPSYFGPMVSTPTGHKLLLYGVVSLLLGHMMVRRIVRIEV